MIRQALYKLEELKEKLISLIENTDLSKIEIKQSLKTSLREYKKMYFEYSPIRI